MICYFVGRTVVVDGSRKADLESLALISVTWLAAIAAGLWLTKSNLPRELRRKKAAVVPNISLPEPVNERTTGGMEP